jgi:small subunit ribosomal protein S13
MGLSYDVLVADINNYYKFLLLYYLDAYVISKAHIERFVSINIKRLSDLQTYKGSRHTLSLPVHGQRTRTNANTQRSKRLIEKNKIIK